MDQGSLVSEEIRAGADLVREFDKYEPVTAAFWLKASDNPHRYLYIASEGVHSSNIDVAYGQVLRIANRLRSPYLDPFRVKLIGASDPLAEAAVNIYQRFPAPLATRISGTTFGGLSVDDVYLYSLPLATSAT